MPLALAFRGFSNWNDLCMKGVRLAMSNNNSSNSLFPLFPSEPHKILCLLIDTSGSMGADIKNNPIGQINEFFERRIFEGHQFDLIDVAIVGFNHNAFIIQDFIPLSKLLPFVLAADGPSAMGEGINKAIDMVKERTRLYQELGTPYFRPWIVMITDGESTDDPSNAINRIKELEEKNKLKMWGAGITGCNCDELKRITRRALYIDIEETSLSEFLDYIFASIMGITAQAREVPGECPKPVELLDGISLIHADGDW